MAGVRSQRVDGGTVGVLKVVQLSADGALDTSFGTGGVAEHMLSQSVTQVRGIAPEPSGKVAVFGTLGLGRPAVARLLPNGALDTSFGEGGVDVRPWSVPLFDRVMLDRVPLP